MEKIGTDIAPVTVEIEGAEYAVAAHTVAVEEAILAAQHRCEGKPAYRLWLAELEILLGRGAVRRLFRAGRQENVDRLQRIHAGVCRAFERNGDAVVQEQSERRAMLLGEYADALAPINELLRRLEQMEAPVLRRRDV